MKREKPKDARRPDTPITDALLEVASEVIAGFSADPDSPKTVARKLAEAAITQILRGDRQFFEEYANRIAGKRAERRH